MGESEWKGMERKDGWGESARAKGEKGNGLRGLEKKNRRLRGHLVCCRAPSQTFPPAGRGGKRGDRHRD